jgi:LysR family pca operon transcriptional activator
MELTDLRIFCEVVESGAISRAAARLHMGQPTVSQRILALEEEIGQPLFVRHRRGVRLTEAGELLADYARRALRLIDEGIGASRAAGTGTVHTRLAGPASVNGYFLAPLLDRLHASGAQVTLHDAHSYQVMQSLIDGVIDVGFVLNTPVQPGIRQWTVHHDPIVCVAAATHPLVAAATQFPLSLADLARADLVFYQFSHDSQAWADALQKSVGSVRRTLTVTPVEAVKALVREHGYVSFVPEMTIKLEVERGEMAILPLADLPLEQWHIALVYRDRKCLPEPVQRVVAAAREVWGRLR